jgi:hypothetical protein
MRAQGLVAAALAAAVFAVFAQVRSRAFVDYDDPVPPEQDSQRAEAIRARLALYRAGGRYVERLPREPRATAQRPPAERPFIGPGTARRTPAPWPGARPTRNGR